MSKIIALIVAGGDGKRFGSNIPKQYINSILTRTIKAFLASTLIDKIQVVIRPEDLHLYNQAVANLDLLMPPVFGGNTRSASVKHGLRAIAQYQPDLVLVHDANRPFVSIELIHQIINQLKLHPGYGIVPCLPIVDTVKRLHASEATTVARDHLVTVQTPQGFYFQDLWAIYQKLNSSSNTDESSLMDKILYIQGEKANIKITHSEDDNMKAEIRSGIGFDAHRFIDQIAQNHNIIHNIILGGIAIPFDKSIEAHSDGDVLIHALVDAILGAIGEGDIGMHFSPSDSKWKNANSALFLQHANDLLKQKNASINNIDIIVICEAPRLGIYRTSIQQNLATILAISSDKVNIKATTTEKMGFTGRGEGIAVQAIVTVSL